MSRIRRPEGPPAGALRGWLLVLAAANLALLGGALALGAREVTDGAASVTTGWLVAAGIVATAAVAWWGLPLLPLAPRTLAHARVMALGAQALHASGHLLGFYYAFWFYDDVLHATLVLWIGLLAFEASSHPGFLFRRQGGAKRVAWLVWLTAVAAAGVWELFEFLADVIAGTREQDNLFDTMVDMLDGALGGAVAAGYAARAVSRDERAKRLADARSDDLLD